LFFDESPGGGEFAFGCNLIEIMVRLPYRGSPGLGLDWETWMRERLVDCIVPTHYWPNQTFDVNIDAFVSMRNRTGVKVIPTIWQALGFVGTDPQPGDAKKRIRRYDKPKTQGIFFAQAMLFHRAGADGLQLGFSSDQWVTRPWLNDLADPAKVEFADKQYMVDPKPHCPVTFPLPRRAPYTAEKTVPLRIGDDIAKAKKAGYDVEATLIVYARPLQKGEQIAIHINDHAPAVISPDRRQDASGRAAVDLRKQDRASFIHDRDWWRRGELRTSVEPDWFRLGKNEIRLVYTAPSAEIVPPLRITWIDLILRYKERPQRTGRSWNRRRTRAVRTVYPLTQAGIIATGPSCRTRR